MARRLLPFLVAPPLAAIILAVFGDTTTAAIIGIVVAGLLGGIGAWLAFGRDTRLRRGRPADVETMAAGIRVVPIPNNGDRPPLDEADTRALVHVVS